MAAAAPNCAVREVAQVYELIKTHHHLLLNSGEPATTQTQLAHRLLGEALRALTVALSVMKMKPPASAAAAASSDDAVRMSVKAKPQLMISSSTSPANSSTTAISTDAVRGDGGGIREKNKSVAMAGGAGRKRRRISGDEKSSWVNLTAVPHDDGYQWRKYGEKKIQGTHFTRSYFRCTFRDDKGCHATKQIQQQDNNHNNTPTMFQVTYTTEHTCNTFITPIHNINSLTALPSPVENNRNNCRSDHHQHDAICSKMMIKQERPHEQAAHRLPEPLSPEVSPSSSKIYCSATVSSSNTTVAMEEEDPYLYDLDLLYDSFKYY